MEDKIVLTGSLNFLGIGDIMQLLGASSSTGVLRLVSRYAPEPGFVYFKDGNPINAQNGVMSGLDALYSLFGWLDGEFEFAKESIAGKKVIDKSRMGIILEGLKLLDDGLIKKLGPSSVDTSTARKAIIAGTSSSPIVKGPLVDYMYVVDEEDFFDGERIVEEGKHGSWLWVILEGVVEIVKESEKGSLPIIRVGDGSFIGSISSFFLHGNIRTATAVAVGNVQLGVLDSQRLSQEYSALSLEFKGFLSSLDKRLKNATDKALRHSIGKIDPRNIPQVTNPFIKQGKTEEKLYVIKQGNASIIRHTSSGPVDLGSLFTGDYIGHAPFLLMNHEPDYASVIGSKNLKASKVDKSRFQEEYDGLSTTFKNLVDNLATCVSVTSDVACNNFKKNLKK